MAENLIEEIEIGWCPDDFLSNFSGRITFPIFSSSGDIVGFSARTTTAGISPKFVNSPESDIYKKSKILYGLNWSQDYILKEGSAIIVEGQFDFIRLWGAGIKNAVAISGTALSRYQCRLLRRFADSVVLCLDSDQAGRSASLRSLDILKEELIPARDVVLPDGLDPDDFIVQYGSLEFMEKIA